MSIAVGRLREALKRGKMYLHISNLSL
jgi:hypothetical protein